MFQNWVKMRKRRDVFSVGAANFRDDHVPYMGGNMNKAGKDFSTASSLSSPARLAVRDCASRRNILHHRFLSWLSYPLYQRKGHNAQAYIYEDVECVFGRVNDIADFLFGASLPLLLRKGRTRQKRRKPRIQATSNETRRKAYLSASCVKPSGHVWCQDFGEVRRVTVSYRRWLQQRGSLAEHFALVDAAVKGGEDQAITFTGPVNKRPTTINVRAPGYSIRRATSFRGALRSIVGGLRKKSFASQNTHEWGRAGERAADTAIIRALRKVRLLGRQNTARSELRLCFAGEGVNIAIAGALQLVEK
ncbi:hypothetical protein EDD18DRAFT_1100515 [Armillaria luteobubalina]|uniref:Uncharacterized protein n=1 Tax=Armillaria luteobubalina TaxID=153913 RepID=A0AA39V1Q5_9AGAR|nr:hypothetical protein EDD18DRAFT_1100515 [Armillaria luteobubalina]